MEFEPQTYWLWAKPPNQYTREGVVSGGAEICTSPINENG